MKIVQNSLTFEIDLFEIVAVLTEFIAYLNTYTEIIIRYYSNSYNFIDFLIFYIKYK